MKPIRVTLWSLPIGLGLLWVSPHQLLAETVNVITIGNDMVQYFGALNFGVMSVAVIRRGDRLFHAASSNQGTLP